MIKKLLEYKVKKKLFLTILNVISAVFTSVFGLLTVMSVAITFFIVGIYNSSNGDVSDIGALGVPQEYVKYFNEAAEVFNIPNWCLAAVAKQESNFNPNASYGGAYGMMQIQKNDIATGKDLWEYQINMGLGEEYSKLGYSFSTSNDMWNTYLKDPRAQIIAGAYNIRYYANYVLKQKGYTQKLDYNNNENMKLIDWNASENNSEFSEIVRRIFACYNGGPGYGMSVDLDGAQHNYPNKVFKYAMEFRNAGLTSGGSQGDNETIEKAIKAGEKWVGKSPYVWGGGRNQADVDAGRFDCSSFVHYMYAEAGIQLGDRASAVTFSMVNMGKKIDRADMKRGDMIFFDTYTIDGHIGVYLGDNKFIHDGPTRGVEVSDMKNPYWIETFNGKVRRVVNVD